MLQWIYGKQSVRELMRSDLAVRKILLAAGSDPKVISEFSGLARSRNIACDVINKKTLDNLVKGNHQGVAAETELPGSVSFKDFSHLFSSSPDRYVCLLDEIQDPQNLGAVARSALAFNCLALILPTWRSAGLNPTVLKSSSGAAAHIPFVEIANLQVAIERLKEKGFWVYGTDAREGEPLDKVQFQFPVALILGNENRGIKPVLRKSCDAVVTIPQGLAIASLNVSSAASIFFYEIFRQSRLVR